MGLDLLLDTRADLSIVPIACKPPQTLKSSFLLPERFRHTTMVCRAITTTEVCLSYELLVGD